MIRELRQGDDDDEWLRLRCLLWPDDADELRAAREEPPEGSAVFVYVRDDGRLGGMVEVGVRDVAEGAVTSPVGYVEAWFVDVDLRKAGVGRALVARAEAWAREQGCSEMGSDTWLHSLDSQRAHAALGYRETERLVTFLKKL